MNLPRLVQDLGDTEEGKSISRGKKRKDSSRPLALFRNELSNDDSYKRNTPNFLEQKWQKEYEKGLETIIFLFSIPTMWLSPGEVWKGQKNTP